jgi:uncharacterized GH25 family protein
MMVSSLKAAELKGQVFKVDGSPAAGALVTAGGLHLKPPLRVTTKADEEGRFSMTVKPLPNHWWCVHATWENQTGKPGEEGLVSVPKESSSAQVEIRLSEGGALQGVLLREEDESPITNATMFFDTGIVIKTDNAGRFATRGLALKDHSVLVVAQGVRRRYVLFDTTLQKDAQLDLRLEAGREVRGKVVDEAGNPIPGAYVTQPRSGTVFTLNGYDQTCAADGTFTYDGIPLGSLQFTLQADAPGYEELQHVFPMEEGEEALEHVFILKSTKKPAATPTPATEATTKTNQPSGPAKGKRNLTGTVVNAAGEPVKSAVVRWGASEFEQVQRSCRADGEGKFALNDVPDRRGMITVIGKGYAPNFVEVQQGQLRATVRMKEGPTVRGVVRNKQGKGIAGVKVIAVLPSPDPQANSSDLWLDERSAKTDAEGKFMIESLPLEPVKFDILQQGYSELRDQTLKLNGADNEIKLTAGGALRGRVVDHSGQPVRNFRVRVMIPRDNSLRPAGGYYAGFENGIYFTRDDGTFLITDVVAGNWHRLIAQAPGMGQAIAEKVQSSPLDDLPPAEQLTLRLTPSTQLRVRVSDAEGKQPLRDATVFLIDKEPSYDTEYFQWGSTDDGALSFRTDPDGWARCEKLAMSEGTVVIRSPGYARQRLGWRNGETEIERVLLPEGVISGTVTQDGKPIEECLIRILSDQRDQHQKVLQPRHEGAFSFQELPPGTYELTVMENKRRDNAWRILANKTVVLKTGERVELNLPAKKVGP